MSHRLDRFEAAVLATLAALAFAVLGGLLLRVWLRGGVVTGADGFLVADPMQYLDWARQAGEHWLIANRHDLADGPRSFLHPGLLLSGLLYRLGAGPAVAYLVWKPVAIGVLFAGSLLFVRRTVSGTGRPAARARAGALLLLAGGRDRRRGRGLATRATSCRSTS